MSLLGLGLGVLQPVDARLRSLRVDFPDDDGAGGAVTAVRCWQGSRNNHRAGGNAARADLLGLAVEDFRTLSQMHSHPDYRVFLDDDAFNH